MPSIIETLLNGRTASEFLERGRREIRGALFHTIAETAIRPRVDELLSRFLRR